MARDKSRPTLHNYNLIQKLPLFLDEVISIALNQESRQANGKIYTYIAIAERRCYNLFCAYTDSDLPDKICTFQGLMTQSETIAKSYSDSKYNIFPSILLVDDSYIHGRRLAKFVRELESSLLFYLKSTQGFSEEKENRFHKDFLNAISIYVFAKSLSTLLLDDRLLTRLQSYVSLSYGQLRDLSLQLSDLLIRWNTPNCDYSPTVFLNQACAEKTKKGWMKIVWNYEEEDMNLFYRINDSENPRWLSTIRTFPRRTENETIPFTSYSMMNAIRKKDLDYLCEEIAELLDSSYQAGGELFVQMKSLLRSDNMYLEGAKRELINYFLSLQDLFKFVKAFEGSKKLTSYKGLKDYRIDTHRIALNFGSDHIVGRQSAASPITTEFDALLSNQSLCIKLEKRMQEFIRSFSTPPVEVDPKSIEWISTSVINAGNDADENINKDVNVTLLRFFSDWGFESEEKAYALANMPYNFDAAGYQEYSYKDDKDELAGRDGGALIISPLAFLKKIFCKSDDDARKHPHYLVFYLASYLFMMDVGILGNKGYCTNDGITATMAKAGEKATFYFPRLVAPFIPAFVFIENCFSLMSKSTEKAIVIFFETMKNLSGEEIVKGLEQNTILDANGINGIIKEWDAYHNTLENSLSKKYSLGQYIKRMYSIGQNFSGWSFSNIVYPKDDFFIPLSKFFYKKATAFMKDWSK